MHRLIPVAMASVLFFNCENSAPVRPSGEGGAAGVQHPSTGGAGGSGTGGSGVGGASNKGGATGSGGATSTGGTSSAGGSSGSGGGMGTGGSAGSGGATGTGGKYSGGETGSGGFPGTCGAASGTTGGSGGSGGSSTSGANTIEAVVDQGPQNIGYVNGLFVTVTLCIPGTNSCQSIDHVLVDTGSSGLRVLESAITLSLPSVKNASGNPLGSCTQFVDGTAWGPILSADVKINGETAAAISLQAIGEKTYPMPTGGACASGQAITDLQSLMANGIIGVGIYQQDCGDSCTQTSRNPGIYFACTSSSAGGCKATAVPLASQVWNPIAKFPVDNNGIVIQLPSVPANGAASTTGKLLFGIGTQANNGLGSATVITPVDAYGNIGTTFPVNGTKYTGFVDSGTNMYTFLDSATSGLALCTSAGMSSLYCPSTTKNLSATIFGGNNASSTVNFSISNPGRISATVAALGTLGSEMPGFPSSGTTSVPDFLWGLPFFYGRTVFTAIEKQDTPGGQGPYVAF